MICDLAAECQSSCADRDERRSTPASGHGGGAATVSTHSKYSDDHSEMHLMHVAGLERPRFRAGMLELRALHEMGRRAIVGGGGDVSLCSNRTGSMGDQDQWCNDVSHYRLAGCYSRLIMLFRGLETT